MKQCCLCGKTGHEASECSWSGVGGTGYQPPKMPDGFTPKPPPRKP